MSIQPLSRDVVQEPTQMALDFTLIGSIGGASFIAAGLNALGSLLTLFSLLLFVGIGVVTVALIVLSLSLRHAAHRLPKACLLEDAVAQHKRETRRSYWVAGILGAPFWLAGILLTYFDHREFIVPMAGLFLGMGFLLAASSRYAKPYYLTGTAFALLSSVALLALVFGVTFSRVYTWTVIVGLGFLVIFWLTILYLLSVGRRLLSQERSS